jgi:hypothetical protein
MYSQIQCQVLAWKALYKQFESQSDALTMIKANEILLDTATMMQDFFNANRNCCSLIANCLDILLNTINYECLLGTYQIVPQNDRFSASRRTEIQS